MLFAVLDYLAQRARHVLLWGLALGILTGLVAPQMAVALQWAVAPIVATLLFLAVLRLGPEGLRAGLHGWRQGLVMVLALQLVVPVVVVLGARGLGLDGALLVGVVLVLAAAPITGSPNLAILSGASGAVALRQLVLGTALLPVTVLPVFLLMPGLGATLEVLAIAARLLVLIALAGVLGLWLRARGIVGGNARSLRVIDGCATLLLAAIVIALMGAVGPALVSGLEGWGVLALALGLGFGMQAALLFALRRHLPMSEAAALSQAAGNRNVALFLGVLPIGMVSEFFLFIGLYQIPMYLTPAVMGWVYQRMGLARSAS
ncbi:MAG: hypothetical protein EA407_12530 [Rhodobacteraceae bacterium]|nr:MAG: hypothetical protein EA407_12530 [Paracoccaceae bacterium]